MSNDTTNQNFNPTRKIEQQVQPSKETSSNSKKWWLWGCGGCGGCLVIIIILSVAFTFLAGAIMDNVDEELQKDPIIQSSPLKTDDSTGHKGVKSEKERALDQAKIYSDDLYMSKEMIYQTLTSNDGDKFPADAAQYAIDNLHADYKQNAVKKAESYANDMNMSKNEIYDQLTSPYGELYTQEEAQYAIDHMK
ncbi:MULTISPECIES: Ltp family lipoprotein [unclassified Staphylococcus]|uniref:Ltp family lipoprotein n=1 Tax=unclassified Staphylococcus TaxID=91994 RepID=UPI0021CE88EE|nr:MULTISPECIES: Ltp family lipoprotein [unclassified Staphylococcus]UXR79075.1 Ltp family lipoprotein [Staphylococcus sp. IVB6227]UXR81828.1 Ltp family lipoprotein [Staphylococcus sp. IVB6214]